MNTKKSSFLLICLLICLLAQSALGQLKNINTEKNIWYPGTLQLMDGKTMKGELNYNFITGTLSHRHDDAIDNYTAQKVAYFTQTLGQGNKRSFYALPYKEKGNRIENFFFFEVIYENSQAAILSRHWYKYKNKKIALGKEVQGAALSTNASIDMDMEKVVETLYLANKEGTILPYAETKKDKSHTIAYNYNKKHKSGQYEKSSTERSDELKYNIANNRALSKITDKHYSKLMSFASKEKIQLNTIIGLVQCLEHYQSLESF